MPNELNIKDLLDSLNDADDQQKINFIVKNILKQQKQLIDLKDTITYNDIRQKDNFDKLINDILENQTKTTEKLNNNNNLIKENSEKIDDYQRRIEDYKNKIKKLEEDIQDNSQKIWGSLKGNIDVNTAFESIGSNIRNVFTKKITNIFRPNEIEKDLEVTSNIVKELLNEFNNDIDGSLDKSKEDMKDRLERYTQSMEKLKKEMRKDVGSIFDAFRGKDGKDKDTIFEDLGNTIRNSAVFGLKRLFKPEEPEKDLEIENEAVYISKNDPIQEKIDDIQTTLQNEVTYKSKTSTLEEIDDDLDIVKKDLQYIRNNITSSRPSEDGNNKGLLEQISDIASMVRGLPGVIGRALPMLGKGLGVAGALAGTGYNLYRNWSQDIVSEQEGLIGVGTDLAAIGAALSTGNLPLAIATASAIALSNVAKVGQQTYRYFQDKAAEEASNRELDRLSIKYRDQENQRNIDAGNLTNRDIATVSNLNIGDGSSETQEADKSLLLRRISNVRSNSSDQMRPFDELIRNDLIRTASTRFGSDTTITRETLSSVAVSTYERIKLRISRVNEQVSNKKLAELNAFLVVCELTRNEFLKDTIIKISEGDEYDKSLSLSTIGAYSATLSDIIDILREIINKKSNQVNISRLSSELSNFGERSSRLYNAYIRLTTQTSSQSKAELRLMLVILIPAYIRIILPIINEFISNGMDYSIFDKDNINEENNRGIDNDSINQFENNREIDNDSVNQSENNREIDNDSVNQSENNITVQSDPIISTDISSESTPVSSPSLPAGSPTSTTQNREVSRSQLLSLYQSGRITFQQYQQRLQNLEQQNNTIQDNMNDNTPPPRVIINNSLMEQNAQLLNEINNIKTIVAQNNTNSQSPVVNNVNNINNTVFPDTKQELSRMLAIGGMQGV